MKNIGKLAAGIVALIGYLSSPPVLDLLGPKAAAAVTVAGGIVYILTGRKPGAAR